VFSGPFQLFQMPVEAFEFGKERSIREITIEDTDRIFRVVSGYEPVAGFFDGFQVSWCDVTCSAYECEIFDGIPVLNLN